MRGIGSALLVLASLARILPVHAFYGWRSHTGNDKQCAPLVATAHVTGQVEANFTFTLIVGQGVLVQIDGLKNFTLRPNITSYNYHIHSSPVNEEAGNITARCAATLSHHDPLNVTENLKCDPEFPYLCQEGDLSGKHGGINATSDGSVADIAYIDPYLRFWPQPFSILGRSVTIHGFNKTRIACGNIISIVDGTADEDGNPTGKKSSYQNGYPPAQKPVVTTVIGDPESAPTDGAYTLPASLIAVSEASKVVLTTNALGQAVASPVDRSDHHTGHPHSPTYPASTYYAGEGRRKAAFDA